MGRGRAKAKQTKVARELKYSSPSTDFASLQKELAGPQTSYSTSSKFSDDESEEDDVYDKWR